MHGDKYDTLKLRLWARTIAGDVHKDYENPPDLPAFGSTPQNAENLLLVLLVEQL